MPAEGGVTEELLFSGPHVAYKNIKDIADWQLDYAIWDVNRSPHMHAHILSRTHSNTHVHTHTHTHTHTHARARAHRLDKGENFVWVPKTREILCVLFRAQHDDEAPTHQLTQVMFRVRVRVMCLCKPHIPSYVDKEGRAPLLGATAFASSIGGNKVGLTLTLTHELTPPF